MATSYKLGREATIKFGEAPNQHELTLAKEVTVELGGAEADVTSRGSSGFRQSVLALKELQITGTAVYDADDLAIQDLFNSYNNGSALTVTLSDPSLTYTGKWQVISLSTPQPLEDVMTIDFTLKPTAL